MLPDVIIVFQIQQLHIWFLPVFHYNHKITGSDLTWTAETSLPQHNNSLAPEWMMLVLCFTVLSLALPITNWLWKDKIQPTGVQCTLNVKCSDYRCSSWSEAYSAGWAFTHSNPALATCRTVCIPLCLFQQLACPSQPHTHTHTYTHTELKSL